VFQLILISPCDSLVNRNHIHNPVTNAGYDANSVSAGSGEEFLLLVLKRGLFAANEMQLRQREAAQLAALVKCNRSERTFGIFVV